MKNLLNFFFSFDKLFKEKLIVPFFWLAFIYFGLKYLIEAVDTVQLDPLLWLIVPVFFLTKLLFTLVTIRIVSELIVAGFRINDNLSADGGKSELADIDPVMEARKAAEIAANRTREATKSLRDNVGEMSENVQGRAKAATASVRGKADDLKSKTGLEKSVDTPEPAKISESTVIDVPKKRGRPAGSVNKSKTKSAKPVATKTAPKKRGRPAGSKNKTTTAKTVKSSTTGKRGPKPGVKIPRDADGNLLKKDGTPRKKPGPKA